MNMNLMPIISFLNFVKNTVLGVETSLIGFVKNDIPPIDFDEK